ncbi:MAG: bifunctional folylpolyglutamate synthase/dihydrofolate synthase [Endomicrobium sp.]|jgi:dihydrofolate synthase/folylpolyglutamate synthase|nr:bifunctional folylpolyglutamate synthase/dihydrofolate synthase [Endomicrobium sp.]
MVFKFLKEYEGMTPGLSRIRRFLKSVGNPQSRLKVIHVAGTNGKGSTAAFISEICSASGYKTALYTSPHLIDITERIKVDGIEISKKIFDDLSEKYSAEALKCKLSYFEYLTSLAFIYFADMKVDIAVIETGLGGRFDATNIIKKPLICIITSIAKEHQEILGTTIEEIAFEKVGIIKKGSYVVCSKLPAKAIVVVKNKTEPYLYGKDFRIINNKDDIYGQKFDYVSTNIKMRNVEVKLLGIHQSINASVAIFTVELLNNSGYHLNETHIRAGLASTVWHGRFDIRKIVWGNKSFKLIIDGAHNVQGLNAFFKTFKQLGFSNEKRVFIFSVMKEKKYKCMVKKVASFAKKVILLKINNSRALDSDILKREFSKYIEQSKVYTASSLKNAYNMIDDGEIVATIGSLYLAGEVLKHARSEGIQMNYKN